MPKIRWTDLPADLRQHLFDRVADRQISAEDLYKLKLWRESEPEAPTGPWYKAFKAHGNEPPGLHWTVEQATNADVSGAEDERPKMNGPMFLLAFGLVLIVLSRRLGSYATRRWTKTFPRLPVGGHIYAASLLLTGVAFLAIGLLSIFGIIPLR